MVVVKGLSGRAPMDWRLGSRHFGRRGSSLMMPSFLEVHVLDQPSVSGLEVVTLECCLSRVDAGR